VVTVTPSISNWSVAGSQTVTLTDTDFTNSQQDDTTVSLTSGESNDSVTLQWTTISNDDGTSDITVATEKESATATATVEETSSNGGSGGEGSGGGSSTTPPAEDAGEGESNKKEMTPNLKQATLTQ